MKNSNISLAAKNIRSSLILLIILLILNSCSANDKIEVVNLRCEYLENPLGIDIVAPRLDWQLKTEKNNVTQKAYQILVSSDATKLENNIGDLWDTKKVISDQSIQIVYEGIKLKSRQKVFWKVRIWDEENEVSEWSKMASWEMALLSESDWKAKWIGKGELPNGKFGQKNPTSYFRKEFIVKNDIKNARAYISGIGYYELYINGKKVEDHVLSPNQTNYDNRPNKFFTDKRIGNMSTRVLYETFDISQYLQQGDNVAAVILGNGWLYRTERPEYIPLYYNLPRLIAQLEVDYSDGEKEQIVSDVSWKYNKGPIVENSIYYGEVYDARVEEAGWNKRGFDDSKWKSSKIVRPPDGKLRAQVSPPDRVTGTITPVSITSKKNGVYRYDFGTMFSGWVKLKVKGERGNTLKLTFFEDNGTNYDQTDTYILKGDGVEEWEPRFTWHAFRYVEVYSPDIQLTINSLEGKIVHTDVSLAGTFKSSNELFNRILNDYKKTQFDNMHGGVPSDCPHRERRGYTGDGQISAKAAIYSLDMKSFYTKWINDIADAQNKKTGYVPDTAPYQKGGGGVAWGSAYIIIPWYMYLYYGDIAILEKHYSGMKHYVEYLKTITDKEGLIVEKQWGEWATPIPTVLPPSYVSSAYYYYDLTLMQNIATILEKESDAKIFAEVAEKTKNAFNRRYYKPNESSYSI
ncbi:alpha-L-rhamnosidase, partial [hydrothermal vent metagenome]